MSTHAGPFVDPMDIVRELTILPHRGAVTGQARLAGDILERHLRQLGAAVERRPFPTPKTYITPPIGIDIFCPGRVSDFWLRRKGAK